MISLASDSEWGNSSSSLSTAVLIIKRRSDHNDVCPSCFLMTKPQAAWGLVLLAAGSSCWLWLGLP